MKLHRRDFLRFAGATGALLAAAPKARGQTAESQPGTAPTTQPGPQIGANLQAGCLVDTTLCIGCRKCEEACNRANNLPMPARPFTDRDVLRAPRRMSDQALTVINSYPGAPSPDQRHARETFVKSQCMHCLDAACVSACIVGALTKNPQGPVQYHSAICLGCRYCMVACPFQVPAYEYRNPITPRVVKCQFCTDTRRGPSANPACAEACPVEAVVFGTRGDLLTLARQRLAAHPQRYLQHIYGEYEVGGTAWLYLMGRSPSEIGLLELPTTSPARLTEKIQHSIFKYGAIPLATYGALGALMWYSRRREQLVDPAPPAARTSGKTR